MVVRERQIVIDIVIVMQVMHAQKQRRSRICQNIPLTDLLKLCTILLLYVGVRQDYQKDDIQPKLYFQSFPAKTRIRIQLFQSFPAKTRLATWHLLLNFHFWREQEFVCSCRNATGISECFGCHGSGCNFFMFCLEFFDKFVLLQHACSSL